MIISFAWTTPALLAGAKTMTRRAWKQQQAAKFRAGMLVDAWDHVPRVRGARKVATIRITRDPWQQRTSLMTEDDFKREGIAWLVQSGIKPRDVAGVTPTHSWRQWWGQWIQADELVYVVEFELVEVLGSTIPRQGPSAQGRADAQHFSNSRGGHGS